MASFGTSSTPNATTDFKGAVSSFHAHPYGVDPAERGVQKIEEKIVFTSTAARMRKLVAFRTGTSGSINSKTDMSNRCARMCCTRPTFRQRRATNGLTTLVGGSLKSTRLPSLKASE